MTITAAFSGMGRVRFHHCEGARRGDLTAHSLETQSAELLGSRAPAPASEKQFDAFRLEYNTERPHEALGQDTPASRYRSSPREYPSGIPQPEYPGRHLVKRVTDAGRFRFQQRLLVHRQRGCPSVDRPRRDRRRRMGDSLQRRAFSGNSCSAWRRRIRSLFSVLSVLSVCSASLPLQLRSFPRDAQCAWRRS
jgi:hypothetical protein